MTNSADIGHHPVTSLARVGPETATKLARLGLHTVQDVLFHLPLRYQDRTRVSPIGALRPGMQAMVLGRIELADVAFGRRRSLLVRISDGSGALNMRLFYFSNKQREQLKRGHYIRLFGEVRRSAKHLEMVHPEYRIFDVKPALEVDETLTPVYPTTEGVNQRLLRALVEQALHKARHHLVDWLAGLALGLADDIDLLAALEVVHAPPATVDMKAMLARTHPAQRRLAFEELLAHHLSLRRLREQRRGGDAPKIAVRGALYRRFLGLLGFDLTRAQQRVIAEVVADLKSPYPAMRLIQGDVGSGKTVVAAAACLHAIEAGCQVALMAPTELLAEQHMRNFAAWFGPLDIDIVAVMGKATAAERRRSHAALASGAAQLAVGTHALFQSGVEFEKLGLIVVDEQHRFGVGQRFALLEKGLDGATSVHQINMTATPIPRTMAMVFYADMDVSAVDELPPGRQPVETVVVADSRRHEVVARVQQACSEGRQVYWVCPLIDESDVLEAQAATETEKQLSDALPELDIALIHGRMKSVDKDALMNAFRRGDIQLLVATTVIEVGVDVPNASLMIIENAERLGLSQLHQLRGRVGRGSARSACVLLYKPPLGAMARARLAAMRDTSDGFKIAERDLELRGPGEVLGTRQTGAQQLKVADLSRDGAMIGQIERVAAQLLGQQSSANQTSVDALIARWVGVGVAYGNV